MQQEIEIYELPEIEEIAFRGFRGELDYPQIVNILEGSKDFDQAKRVTTLEDIQRSYSHLTNCNPYRDMLFAEVDGAAVAYCRVFWQELLGGEMIYWHFGTVLPDWRRRGIGRVMLRWSERRLTEIASVHKQDAARFYQTFGEDTQVGKEPLVLSEGYEPVRYDVEMARPLTGKLPEVPMPESLEVRPAKDKHVRQIWDASVEAFRDHWGFSEPTEESFKEWLEERTFNPELWKVAWDGDQVAGMVLNFIDDLENREYDRKRGYTETICVRRPWRRRGLARSLIAQSFHFLRDLGMEEAALGVDTQNLSGAFRLYESLGFKQVKRWTEYRKPFEV